MASLAPDTSFFTSVAISDISFLKAEPSATNACDDGSDSSNTCSSAPETPSPSPSPSPSSASASPPPAPSGSSTTYGKDDASNSSDPNVGIQAGIWTGFGVMILILMAISGWFFYRRGKKKQAKSQQADSDQEQGSTDTSNSPPGDLLTRAKPELSGDSTDPVRVPAELQVDLEEPFLKNGGSNAAATTAVVVGELDGTPSTSIPPVELPGSPPPLRVVPAGGGQTRTRAENSGSSTEDSGNLTDDNTTGEGILGDQQPAGSSESEIRVDANNNKDDDTRIALPQVWCDENVSPSAPQARYAHAGYEAVSPNSLELERPTLTLD
ncbi:hypothetical protein QBC37DRAFT_455273 [Rhypophila decipiens]|uniref:Uncharacterized protein n=1 Tax=Rhypophila decipiens TaxID=261697 RepID=A0AAN7B478_9PEZI|nr:hypothetical protein QBC37DRAFT_455273 [Rhypophila decipiens]